MNKLLILFVLFFCSQSLYSGEWVAIPTNKWDLDNFIASYDSNNFVICGQYTDLTLNRIYVKKTTDYGNTWKDIDDSYDLCRIYKRKSENEIWAAGFTKEFKQIPFIKKSLDNGVTWDTLFYPTYYQDTASGVPQGLFFYDDPNKVAFPTFSYLYRTIDAGKTWTCDTIPPTAITYLPYWDKGMSTNKGGKLYRLENGTSVQENSLEIPILLFPNPLPRSATLNININYIGLYSSLKLKIVDITGKTVDEFTTDNIRADMNLQYLPDANLPRGSYFLVIESDEGVAAKEKFVVE